MRRTSCHVFALISTISLEALQATKMDEPSAEGSAQVGEHELLPAFGGSEPCPFMSCIPGIAVLARGAGEPIIPISLFFVTMKWRVTFNERVRSEEHTSELQSHS